MFETVTNSDKQLALVGWPAHTQLDQLYYQLDQLNFQAGQADIWILHNINLRSQNAGLLIVPRVGKCTLGGRAFSYRAPLLWNNLPSDIRGADSLSIFKSRLKSYLYSKSFSWGTRLGFGIDHRVSGGLSDHCFHWLLRITLMSVPVPCLMSLIYAAIALFSRGFPLFAHRHLFTPLFLLFCFSFKLYLTSTNHCLFLFPSPLLRALAWIGCSRTSPDPAFSEPCYFSPPCAKNWTFRTILDAYTAFLSSA